MKAVGITFNASTIMVVLLLLGCGGGNNTITLPDDNRPVNLVGVNGTVTLPSGTHLQYDQLEVTTMLGGTSDVSSEGNFRILANDKMPISLAIVTN